MLRPWKTIFSITLTAETTLVEQIMDGIRKEILSGRLERGASLPGSRILAKDLGVNRKTVVFAYEALIADGWLESKHKSGTFVSMNLPVLTKTVESKLEQAVANFEFTSFDAFNVTDQALGPNQIVFNEGGPDTRLAPLKELSTAYKRVFQRQAKWGLLGYTNEKGNDKLRDMIALMLSRDRGLAVDPNRLCITRGSQMALYLVARVLIRPGDVIVVENPGYYAVRRIFQEVGALLHPLAVDEEGLDIDRLEKLCQTTTIKAVYVTPHHQFPTTVTMKAGRRMALLALSLRYQFAVIEDDYDHEYHFGLGHKLALASSDNASHVIYISSLSKLIAPAIRVGYVTGPKAFMESLVNLRVQIDRQGDSILEHTIAELMEDGTMSRHARKVAAIYKSRRDFMVKRLTHHFKKQVYFQIPEGGLAIWVGFQPSIDFTQFKNQLAKKGVQIVPPSIFYIDGEPKSLMRLGYGSLNELEMEEGLRIMAETWKEIVQD